MIGNFEDASFWEVFCSFLPCGYWNYGWRNLSGDLANPRKAIPRGTLSAIFLTMIIYISLAFMLSVIATPEALRSNEMIMVERASWGFIVTLGILAATFSSALGSMIGAPRILDALAVNHTFHLQILFY